MVGVIQIIFSLYPNEFFKAFKTGLPKHGYLGLAIMLLGIAQPLNALCRPSKGSALRATWELFHKFTGRILTICGFFNCGLGALLAMKQGNDVAKFRVLLILSISFAVLW